ncbi:MAG: hypothetical protein PHT44_03955 [Candidatus Portnoybacteria bacterium]|nr:hypothetical protein [Candidatus Portnoybacteria bacterium]
MAACSSSPNIDVEQFWHKQDLKDTEALVNSIGGPTLSYRKSYMMKPPFYRGPMPLEFNEYTKNIGGGMMGMESIVLCQDFGEWRNIFVYKDTISMLSRMPAGAIAVDNNSKRIIAECKVMKLLDADKQLTGFEIAEIHYDKNGERAIFTSTFQLDFPMGFKTKEIKNQGKKEREYFFIWPSGF